MQNWGEEKIGIEGLHQESNDNGVRIVNLATSNNLVLKNTMFPHRIIRKYTWTTPDDDDDDYYYYY